MSGVERSENAVTVRDATPQDATALAPLYEQLGYPTHVDEIARRLREVGNGVVLVAVRGKRLVGFAAVEVGDHFVTGTGAELAGLVVAEDERSGGVGAQLLAAAESWARERGLAELLVRSNVIRERAHGFYERHGYARVKSQHLFRKTL